MGSKKLKRKKLKGKKMEKIFKLKTGKHMKSINFEEHNEENCGKTLRSENVTYNRSSKRNCSFFYFGNEDFSEVRAFSKVREDYFVYLQTVISDNCAFYDSIVTEETLQNLALELEQNALLACLQIDIYKKSMCRIIRDIRKSTDEKQVHEEVRKLLPDSTQEKIETSSGNILEVENYSRIPTIASIRTDEDLRSSTNFWMEQSSYNSDAYYSVSGQEIYIENQNESSNAQLWEGNETYSSVLNHSDYCYSEIPRTNHSDINDFDNSKTVVDSYVSASQNNFSDNNGKDKILPKSIAESKEKCETVDPLLMSRSQLQKLVEQTLNETEKIQKQKRDEQERAYIAQILEGDDCFDDRLNDSLSDNENESKENIDESNLMNRLEKMRELFGVEEEENSADTASDKPQPNVKIDIVNSRSRRPTGWRYEKFIQLHKYSLIAAEMSCERKNMNRKFFLEIFGEDSDEEHEVEYLSEEKYRSSCAERISSWVVKYLMPFYHDKRILGRNVFKTLGHHISDTIVDAIQYPDEWTVKYFVSKFFPPKKKYACDADVLNFQLD